MFSLLGLTHAIIGVIGGASASISLYLLFRTHAISNSPFGVCLTNLALNQIGFSLFGHLTFVVPTYFANIWLWGLKTCQFFGFLTTFFQRNILGSMSIICVERYLLPTKHSKPEIMFKLTVFAWLYNGIWTLFPFIGWGRYERKTYSCTMLLVPSDWNGIDFSYTCIQIFATLILPSSVMFHVLRLTSRRDEMRISRTEHWSTDTTATMRVTVSLAASAFTFLVIANIIGFSDVSADTFRNDDSYVLEHVHLLFSHMMCFISPIFYWTNVFSIRKDLARRKPRVSFAEEMPLKTLTYSQR